MAQSWLSYPFDPPTMPPGGTAARRAAVARARANAPFLERMAATHPDTAEAFVAHGTEVALERVLAPDPLAVDDVAMELRRWRGQVALLTALGDLSGELDLFRTTRILSDFADAAVDVALTAAFAERVPGEAPRGLAVIAMGKLGSHELNYSSDIDPILLFDPATLPHRSRDDVGEAAVRIGRRMMELLSARTADGHVLRVDLRLRPSPEVTPIVLPVDAAISYYESQALPWEQAAFIRTRASSGDTALGQSFLDAIDPFIWRRSLDFRQVREIGAVSERIRDHYAQGQAFGPGYDLKRGRGGIREVEFFAQVHQLIFGGREPALRLPATCDALAALAAAGRIDAGDAARLADHYRLYRRIEHRLQMVDDQQTHSLPTDAEALDRVARLDGLADGAALLDLLRGPVADVGAVYDGLVREAAGEARLPHDAVSLLDWMGQAGFDDPDAAAARVAEWRSGSVRVLRSAAAVTALERVMPTLMRALGQAPDPAAALRAFDRLIAGLPTAINFFHLLAAQPRLTDVLVRILSHAPTLSDALAVRADLIEGLIDARAFDAPADVATLLREMAPALRAADYELALDRVRHIVGERRFALGVQLIEGASPPATVSRGYSDVAEAALGTLTRAASDAFAEAHGQVPDSELVILALGRFGGGSLTHASDLDLIYLFTGDHLAESDGRRPLGATHYYNRLAQRVTGAMSVPTAAGRLYEVDTRLRPSGAQGPAVVTLDSFARYQREDAWTWEHMALARARVVYGSDAARAALDAIIAEELHRPRDAAQIRADAIKMRADMATHKPPRGDLDVKLIEGGLVDLEFALHTAQLIHRVGFDPRLDVALAQLVDAGHAPPGILEAERLLGAMLVTLRLMAPDSDRPADSTRPLIAAICGARDWDDLMTRYAAARATVRDWWAYVSSG